MKLNYLLIILFLGFLIIFIPESKNIGIQSAWHYAGINDVQKGEDWICGTGRKLYMDNAKYCGPDYDSTANDRYCAIEVEGYTNCYMEFDRINGQHSSSKLEWKRGCRALTKQHEYLIEFDSIKVCFGRNGESAEQRYEQVFNTNYYEPLPEDTIDNIEVEVVETFDEQQQIIKKDVEEITEEQPTFIQVLFNDGRRYNSNIFTRIIAYILYLIR